MTKEEKQIMKNMIIGQMNIVANSLTESTQIYLGEDDYSQDGDYEGDYEALLLNSIDDLQKQAETLRNLRKHK